MGLLQKALRIEEHGVQVFGKHRCKSGGVSAIVGPANVLFFSVTVHIFSVVYTLPQVT